MSYSLEALRKIREHNKNVAQNLVKDALNHHEDAKKKLQTIQQSLKEISFHRNKHENNFYSKSQLSPFNKREVICHASYGHKTVVSEADLKKNQLDQEEEVRITALQLDIANAKLLEAHRNLKILEKHHEMWKKNKIKNEMKKEDNHNDEINGVQFLLRKISP